MTPWEIPKMWEGGECWIIGGGPSVPLEFGVPEDVISAVLSGEQPLSSYSPFLSPIFDKHVIAVNAASFLGDWIDITFFGDAAFYYNNKVAMDEMTKLKVTCNTNIPKKADQKQVVDVKYVLPDNRHMKGITSRENHVSWNLNSGAAAISLAYRLGVRRVYLLGFDMVPSETGAQHFHRHYQAPGEFKIKTPKQLPFQRHLECFPMVGNDARRLGLEIINVSPNSAITAFKRVKLSDVL